MQTALSFKLVVYDVKSKLLYRLSRHARLPKALLQLHRNAYGIVSCKNAFWSITTNWNISLLLNIL